MAAPADDSTAGDGKRPPARAGGCQPGAGRARRGRRRAGGDRRGAADARAAARAARRARASRPAGQALVHVLLAASLRGHIVRGPDGRRRAGVRRGVGLARPAAGAAGPRRGTGPVGAALPRRSRPGRRARPGQVGRCPAGKARRGLDVIADALVPCEDGLVDLADRDRARGLPPPRLLGPFDPLLHGWVSRGAVRRPAPARSSRRTASSGPSPSSTGGSSRPGGWPTAR